MQLFYCAMNAKGEELKGVISADDENVAVSDLKSEGLFPTLIRAASSDELDTYGIAGDEHSRDEIEDIPEAAGEKDSLTDIYIGTPGDAPCTAYAMDRPVECGSMNLILSSERGANLVFQVKDSNGQWTDKTWINFDDVTSIYRTGFLFWKKTHVETGNMYKYVFSGGSRVNQVAEFEMLQRNMVIGKDGN